MPTAREFEPAAIRSFRYRDWALNATSGQVTLRYALDAPDQTIEFSELVHLPGDITGLPTPRRGALDACLRLLWLTAGVSYYKAAAPLQVVVEGPPLTTGELSWCRELYTQGLAEFGFQNSLDLRNRPQWPDPSTDPPRPAGSGLQLSPTALVPVGGGKDSAVTVELLRQAGVDQLLFSVNDNPAILRMVDAAGLPHVIARRLLDPRLTELNASGAFNGHIPITAVVSLIALATALISGCSAVVMSNERSASVGNLSWEGSPVNHQWSKGFAAERALAGLVAAEVSPELTYFSVLRPLSELSILRAFSAMRQYHPVFTSCNVAFRIDEARRSAGWCANCAKCRFVFLGLAPWLGPTELTAIVGANLLEDLQQVDGFLALLGIGADKPFECVGEIEESRAAVLAAASRPEWRSAPLLSVLRDRVIAAGPVPTLAALLVPSPAHAVPERFQVALDALG